MELSLQSNHQLTLQQEAFGMRLTLLDGGRDVTITAKLSQQDALAIIAVLNEFVRWCRHRSEV